MIQVTIFSGRSGELRLDNSFYLTIFGGFELARPTIARQVLAQRQAARDHHATRPRPFFLTIFGGGTIQCPTLAAELIDLQAMNRGGVLDPVIPNSREDEFDSRKDELGRREDEFGSTKPPGTNPSIEKRDPNRPWDRIVQLINNELGQAHPRDPFGDRQTMDGLRNDALEQGIDKLARLVLRGGDLDEAPQVYRKLDDVLAAQGDTIEVVHTLRPLIVCMAPRRTR